MKKELPITVFEHESLKVNQKGFSEKHLLALQRFHGEKGTPFFTLIHNGIRFCEYVGVLKVGNKTIEILPKADKANQAEPSKWRGILLKMLRSVGAITTHTPSYASLSLKSNFILETYFRLYVQEVEKLVHHGLVKKYEKTEGNQNSLKGSLYFPKHIQQNLIHQERFYTRHTLYNSENIFNQILLMGLKLIKSLNTESGLSGRISNLLLSFPELKSVPVSSATFQRLTYNRKTEDYRKAIEIAELLLLNYHPDLSSGRNNILALLFDMNLLWEQYVAKEIQNILPSDWKLKTQSSKGYWALEDNKNVRKLRPDILLQRQKPEDGAYQNIIIDTKWKILRNSRPSDDDIRQMFAYNNYFDAERSYLLYPSEININDLHITLGKFLKPHEEKYCGIIQVPVSSIKDLSSLKMIWKKYLS